MRNADPCAEHSDAELLDAVARHRDRRALHELFDSHEAWVGARLRYRHGDPRIREEVVQDTFVEVWRSAGRYHGDANARPSTPRRTQRTQVLFGRCRSARQPNGCRILR
jgi:DNA-directed RNA polymerase specialized sigma24 family protein